MKQLQVFVLLLAVFMSCSKDIEEDIIPNPVLPEGAQFAGLWKSTYAQINNVIATKYANASLSISIDTIYDSKGRISDYYLGKGKFTFQEYNPLYGTTSTESYEGLSAFQPGTLPGGETYMGFNFSEPYTVCTTESSADGGSYQVCNTNYSEVFSFRILNPTNSTMIIERFVNNYKHRYHLTRVK